MNIHSAHFLPGANKRLGDRYFLLQCLGDGSHGWVWRAERLADGEIVALKIPKDLSKDDRQLVEGKELLGVEPHSNIVQIFDMGRIPPENHWFFIEMEYFPSESLAQKLEQRSHHFGNTFERLFGIYEQVLKAVAYLAGLAVPISHGDIKPHNILVGSNDLVKLTDFGSSALPEEIYVRTRENGGTVLYSAPEFSDCVSRKGTFPELLRGDIYSLGVLLYQLVTGSLPHDTQAQVRRYHPFKKPTEINASIHPELEKVILKCLSKEPSDRFNSIEELQKAFVLARIQQQQHKHYVLPAVVPSHADWSSYVVQALDAGDYRKAARLAETEFQQSHDLTALLHQLNALYRAEHLHEFEKVFRQELHYLHGDDPDTATIRLLAIKTFMALHNSDMASSLIADAYQHQGRTYELDFLSASLAGLQADYQTARRTLEALNREQPGKPQVLSRLVQVCEQLRDYGAAAGYLRAALRIVKDSPALLGKRERYQQLGIW